MFIFGLLVGLLIGINIGIMSYAVIVYIKSKNVNYVIKDDASEYIE